MPLETFLSGALGAFIAAWAGAYVGFRRGKKERALDKRIAWHELVIQSLAAYEDRLERLRSHALNALTVQAAAARTIKAPPPRPEDLPRLFKAPSPLWAELTVAEIQARAALRLGDLYTKGRLKIECSVALRSTVNVVTGHWIDVSPEPEIPWAHLQSKALAVATVREKLQDSLKLVLELDGFLANLLGPRYRQRRALREIEKVRAEIAGGAS